MLSADGRVCRTTAEVSFAGAEGTWLTHVRVSARIVGSSKAHSRSTSENKRGRRGWDTTMMAKRVWVTGGTVVTVYLALFMVVPSRLT